MTDPDTLTGPQDPLVTDSDVQRMRTAVGTTGVQGTDTEVALPGNLPAAAAGEQSLTRSEEHLQVGTETVVSERVYLRRRVVTEEQTITVQVSHDEVELVREPVEPGTDPTELPAVDGAGELILTEERVVVTKEVVPVERVRLQVDTVTEQRTVTDTVRKEHLVLHHDPEIDTDLDAGTALDDDPLIAAYPKLDDDTGPSAAAG